MTNQGKRPITNIQVVIDEYGQPAKSIKGLGTPTKPYTKILEEDVFLGASFEPCQNESKGSLKLHKNAPPNYDQN
jgi:hypothetical protein